jgi:hypothetical protein
MMVQVMRAECRCFSVEGGPGDSVSDTAGERSAVSALPPDECKETRVIVNGGRNDSSNVRFLFGHGRQAETAERR